jgi:predicted GIY-YIG superfamily endonuclease
MARHSHWGQPTLQKPGDLRTFVRQEYRSDHTGKQIKAGSRTKKLALIEALNRDWKDLYESLI